MSEATPRPWRCSGGCYINLEAGSVEDKTFRNIARIGIDREWEPTDAETEANAELILTAVNTYDEREALIRELLAELKECRTRLYFAGLSTVQLDRRIEDAERVIGTQAPDAAPRPGHEADETGEG